MFPPSSREVEHASDVVVQVFLCMMTSSGMASFPGTLPLVSESISLPRSSSVGSVSSSVITGRLSMVYR